MLSKDMIESLASRKGVKRIAVVNFLSTVDANKDKDIALSNLNYDRLLYRWNAATIEAIRRGILLHFDK